MPPFETVESLYGQRLVVRAWKSSREPIGWLLARQSNSDLGEVLAGAWPLGLELRASAMSKHNEALMQFKHSHCLHIALSYFGAWLAIC